MSKITLGGKPVETVGNLPEIGSKAANFTLTDANLKDFSLSDYSGKRVVLNIFPSINTGVCSASVREFNKRAAGLDNTVVIGISKDLPFAHKQFCGSEGIENVVSASQYKNTSFSDNYKVEMTNGNFEKLFSRAVVILDENGTVMYTEQVPEIGQEPNYDAAVAALG
jgi:thiol peroxidase